MKTIKKLLPILIFFLAGLGTIKAFLSLFVIFSIYFYTIKREDYIERNLVNGLGISLVTGFIFLYYVFYQPPEMPGPSYPPIDFWNYWLKGLPILFTFPLILSYKDQLLQRNFLFAIASGMFAYASLTTAATLYYLDPPYYGKAYHLIYKVPYNSPGVTILASILPLSMLSFSNSKTIRSTPYMIGLFISLFISICISIMFSARTFFFILLIIGIIKLVQFFLENKEKKRFISLTVGVFTFIGLVIISLSTMDNLYLKNIFHRIQTAGFGFKILHFTDYLSQIGISFFQYPKDHSGSYWFHNFFFDAHRTSGPWIAIILYIYFIFTLGKSVLDAYRNTSLARELMILYISFIPYLFFSIPWESSESQMTLFYMSFTAMIINNNRKYLMEEFK